MYAKICIKQKYVVYNLIKNYKKQQFKKKLWV